MSDQLITLVKSVLETTGIYKKNIMALDIGLSAVKVAEMQNTSPNKYTLLKYASVPLPEGSLIEDEIQNPEEIIKAIVKAIKIAGITTKNCCLGLSGNNTIVKKLSITGGTFEAIEDQVIWESEQYLPFDIAQTKISFHILGENEGGGVDVVVGAATNNLVNSFKDLAQNSHLKVRIVDLNILALVNIFELTMSLKNENLQQSFLILDIGAQKTSFVVYKNQSIKFHKDINLGGVMITEEIQRKLGVSYEEAEELKIVGDEKGNLPQEIVTIIDDITESFFIELKKTLDFYLSSTPDEIIAKCFVTGGGGLIPGMLEGLEALFGVTISILNPFDAITYNKNKFSQENIDDICYKGPIALGLAMRGL